MKRPKTYKAKITVNSDGSLTIHNVVERHKINQHRVLYSPKDKEEFFKILKKGVNK